MVDDKDGTGQDAGAVEQDDAVIGKAFWRSLAVLGGLVAMACIGFLVLRGGDEGVVNRETEQRNLERRGEGNHGSDQGVSPATLPTVLFEDITESSGITFSHVSGAAGEKLLPETMGGGCGFIDFDNDGDQDILFVNSRPWPWDDAGPGPVPLIALYANDGTGKFQDVTTGSGLDVSLYGMGCAIADYDNDGDSDIFISCVGSNHLFQNDNGKFVDISAAAGIGGDAERWSTSCGWFDYNNDGLLDLYVCNYVQWSRDIDLGQDFRLVGVGRAYGPPNAFSGSFPYLYRNDGGGKFTDVSADMGVQVRNVDTGVPVAKSMGVAPIDLNGDGWMDLIVANDTVRNFLFLNENGKRFVEMGQIAGIAFDGKGSARGAMGIDTAYFRNGRREAETVSDTFGMVGVAIGNFANEMSALYVSQGGQMNFRDEAVSTGLGPPTRLDLTFGLFFFDYDLDGRLDLFGANGHLEEEINKVQPSQFHAQEPQLFWNAGLSAGSEFMRVPNEQSGSGFANRLVGRGAAFADIDRDGDPDILITAAGGPARLLRNEQQTSHSWITFELTGTKGNRDAIGAWIEVSAGQDVYRRQLMPTRSYLSQAEASVTFGLGTHDAVRKAIIRWPGGGTTALEDLPVNNFHQVVEPSDP